MRVLHWLAIGLRLALGALFLFSGADELLHFWPPPAPATPQSQVFMHGLVGSGYMFPPQGAAFSLSGLALLANGYVALALVVLAAPVAVIFGYHAIMQNR